MEFEERLNRTTTLEDAEATHAFCAGCWSDAADRGGDAVLALGSARPGQPAPWIPGTRTPAGPGAAAHAAAGNKLANDAETQTKEVSSFTQHPGTSGRTCGPCSRRTGTGVASATWAHEGRQPDIKAPEAALAVCYCAVLHRMLALYASHPHFAC